MTVTIVENALYVPPQQEEGARLRSGVFDATGAFVTASAMMQSHGRLSHSPDLRAAEAEMAGTHLYAGIGRAHFGHFLLETVTRHWALADHRVDSVLIAPMPGTRMRLDDGPLLDLHNILSDSAPLSFPMVPTRIERLIVPEQGIGHGPLLTGTPQFNAFAQQRLHALGSDGPERLYVSRSQLRARKARMDQEDLIEAHLRRAGYTIFHPQQHSFAEQCRAYRAASFLVGPDGSPCHLAALVAQPTCRMGIILRRNRPEMLERLARQITAFTGTAPTCINPVLPLEEQRKLTAGNPNAPTPLDLDQVFAEIDHEGFL